MRFCVRLLTVRFNKMESCVDPNSLTAGERLCVCTGVGARAAIFAATMDGREESKDGPRSKLETDGSRCTATAPLAFTIPLRGWLGCWLAQVPIVEKLPLIMCLSLMRGKSNRS
jgi:hypothetical protein